MEGEGHIVFKKNEGSKQISFPIVHPCTNFTESLFQLEKDALLIYVSDNKRGTNYTFTTAD